MKIVKISIIFTIFITLLLPTSLTPFIRDIPNDIQPSLEGTQIVYKEISISQSFISEKDDLSGIGMSIKNPFTRNKKDMILNILSEGNLIRTVTLKGTNIQDGHFVKINFEPINNSSSKKYSLQILSPDSESEEALEIFLTSQKVNWMEGLYVNSEIQDSNLSFVVFHRISNPVTVALEIYIQAWKRLFMDLPFALFYSFLIVSLTIYCLTKFLSGHFQRFFSN